MLLCCFDFGGTRFNGGNTREADIRRRGTRLVPRHHGKTGRFHGRRDSGHQGRVRQYDGGRVEPEVKCTAERGNPDGTVSFRERG